MMEYAFFQGRIVPFADARISIGTHTVQYGTGAFAGIRGYLDDDGERSTSSACPTTRSGS